MRKLHIVLLGTFLTGVLLAGIGTGIAFGEYSGFEYDGKIYLGEENAVTKEIDYTFTSSENEKIRLNNCRWGDWKKDTLIVELVNNYFRDDFAALMENKNKILEGLKQKKIASYEIVDIMDVEILVNPKSMPYMDDYTRKY